MVGRYDQGLTGFGTLSFKQALIIPLLASIKYNLSPIRYLYLGI